MKCYKFLLSLVLPVKLVILGRLEERGEVGEGELAVRVGHQRRVLDAAHPSDVARRTADVNLQVNRRVVHPS